VTAYDPDEATVLGLTEGRLPVQEPGLAALVEAGLERGTLRFTTDATDAVADAEVVWVTFDTPIDEDGRGDADAVVAEIERLLPLLSGDATLLVSSQLPVGTTRRLEQLVAAMRPATAIGVAASPENLQLGRAIDAFLHPPRIVVGARRDDHRRRIARVLEPLGTDVVWMAPESAEMSKHALNGWLATSVAFTNEVASICEETGARADEVERALRSDPRVGPHAYVHAGDAYAGGTLARDLAYLGALGAVHGVATPLLASVAQSNEGHARWAGDVLERELATLQGARIVVLGLTYKPGTDTLRGSRAVELCRRLVAEGADVHVHDPAARDVPPELSVKRHADVLAALRGAQAVVISTPWPEYADLAQAGRLAEIEPGALVVDPTGLLGTLGDEPRITYRAVGRPR
jgi:UDPglucose 6-dehydrogenase